jgi:hypothetical protein
LQQNCTCLRVKRANARSAASASGTCNAGYYAALDSCIL